MADQLGADLLARIKARAKDPTGRSDMSEMAANSASMDEMVDSTPKSDDPAVREYLEGMNTPFAGMISNMVAGDGSQAKGFLGMLGGLLGGKQMFASIGDQTFSFGAKSEPTPAPPPCAEAQVATAEAKLGFAIPPALRQFYLEVADGGVGPGDGIYSLKEMVAKWREFTKEPIGERGQKWPAKVLPFHGDDWDVTCIDRDTGQLIFWDVEEIDYGGWKKSFKPEAESLEAWLDKWLGKPTAAEKAKRRAERAPREPRQLTDEDWRVWGEQAPLHKEYLRRLDIATMTPAERAAIGLTEDNWAEKMWEGLDLTSIKFPTPGFAERQAKKAE
jgi:hypothetical protein